MADTWIGRVPAMARAAVGVVFLAAGIWKLAEPEPLSRFLARLSVQLTRNHHDVALACVIGGYEAALGVALLMMGRSPVVRAWAAVTLLAYSALLAYLAMHSLGGCPCMGSVGRTRLGSFAGIGRNLGLLGLVWAGGAMPPTVATDEVTGPERAPSRYPELKGERGFTLIELLLVVAIVSVLIALIVGQMRGVRDSARDSSSLSTMRQVMVALDGYGNDYNDTYPYFATPAQPWQPLATTSGAMSGFSYFSQSRHYQLLLYPGYYSDSRSNSFDSGTASNSGKPSQARYWLAQGLYAAEKYWITEQPPNDLTLYRACPRSEVALPSRKGSTLDARGGQYASGRLTDHLPKLILVGFFDGSGSERQYTTEVEKNVMDQRPYGCVPWAVLATRRGLGGVDF